MPYHMRRADKSFNDPTKLRTVLKQVKYITLAMCSGGKPYLVSLNHAYDEEHDCIYVHCAPEGKKLNILRENPNVWGQAIIDHGFYGGNDDCRQNFVSVMFEGTFSLVTDPAEKLHAFVKTNEGLGAPSESLQKVLDAHLGRATVGKITITDMTGKKSKEITL
jgi:nitroimidazol reductase NimA-like FMN-containing flavoprotein (pyridoxamine 5'-phosphate oxidase superfamily)